MISAGDIGQKPPLDVSRFEEGSVVHKQARDLGLPSQLAKLLASIVVGSGVPILNRDVVLFDHLLNNPAPGTRVEFVENEVSRSIRRRNTRRWIV